MKKFKKMAMPQNKKSGPAKPGVKAPHVKTEHFKGAAPIKGEVRNRKEHGDAPPQGPKGPGKKKKK